MRRDPGRGECGGSGSRCRADTQEAALLTPVVVLLLQYSHFTDKEVEAQRIRGVCQRFAQPVSGEAGVGAQTVDSRA